MNIKIRLGEELGRIHVHIPCQQWLVTCFCSICPINHTREGQKFNEWKSIISQLFSHKYPTKHKSHNLTAYELFHEHSHPYLHDNNQPKFLFHATPLQPAIYKSIIKLKFKKCSPIRWKFTNFELIFISHKKIKIIKRWDIFVTEDRLGIKPYFCRDLRLNYLCSKSWSYSIF